MPTITYGNWSIGVALSDLLNEASVHHRLDNYDHLGNDAAAQNSMLAAYVNRVIEDALDSQGGIGYVTSAAIPIAVADASFDIPADLRGRDIVEGILEDSVGHQTRLTFIGRATASGLPADYSESWSPSARPQSISFNEAGDKLMLWPISGASYSAYLVYRQGLTYVSAANIADPGSVTIGEVPTRMQLAMALNLAARICDAIKPDLAAGLRRRYSNPEADSDPRQEPGELERVLRALRWVPAVNRGSDTQRDGLINTRAYFKGFRRFD